MGRVTLILILAVVLVVVGGCLFLAFWNIPAPHRQVETVLPDARFPR